MNQKKPFNKSRIWLYAIIIIAIAYFFSKNSLDVAVLKNLRWSGRIGWSIFFAFLMLLIRDIGYVLRLRLLTENKISLRTSIRIILLWEFGSAITPGMIGGKAVAIYLLIKNKINAAQASSVVLLAILLDEFIFVILFPIFYFIIGPQMLHGDTSCPDWLAICQKMPILNNIVYLENTIFIMLSFILIFVVTAFVGIFIYPIWIHNMMRSISKLSFLKKSSQAIEEFGEDLFRMSHTIRAKGVRFWVALLSFTLLSWVGRYLVGVAIVWGFANDSFDMLTVYTKQYALWLMFYIPSTPGSSGIAEALYMAFYCEFIQNGMAGTAAFLWRFMSYYVYLVIGFFLLFFGGERAIIEEE